MAELTKINIDQVVLVTQEEIASNTPKNSISEQSQVEMQFGQTEKRKCALLISIGSRGDVNPFIALGEELMSRGYHVRLATHLAFKSVVEKYGFEYCKVAGDPKVLMNMMSSSDSISSPTYVYRNLFLYRTIMKELLNDVWEHISQVPSDMALKLVVANPISHCGIHIAEYLQVPAVMLFTMPWTSSREFPFPMYVSNIGKSSPSALNPHSYVFFETTMWMVIKDIINEFREQKLKLPSLSFNKLGNSSSNVDMHGRKVPFIYCWSKLVIPKPVDWGPHIMISGYLMSSDDRKEMFRLHGESENAGSGNLVEGFSNSNALNEFVEKAKQQDPAGPLYIGFGSINCNPQDIERIVASITRSLHLLACSKTPSGRFGIPGAKYIIIQALNHKEIFERCLSSRENMCTAYRSRGFFQASEPQLYTQSCDQEKKNSPPPFFRNRSESASTIVEDEDDEDENEESKSRAINIPSTEINHNTTDESCAGTPGNEIKQDKFNEASLQPDLSQIPIWERLDQSNVSMEEAEAAWLALQERIIIIEEAKHSWLFPQCSLVVHHGGAGTFMTSVHAGVPQIVVPFFGDQFLWADIAVKRNVGQGIAATTFSTVPFLKSIEFCLLHTTVKVARELGKQLRDELRSKEGNGVVRAADAIESWMNHSEDRFDPDLASKQVQDVMEPSSPKKQNSIKNSSPEDLEGTSLQPFQDFIHSLGFWGEKSETSIEETSQNSQTLKLEGESSTVAEEAISLPEKARGCSGDTNCLVQ